MSDPNFVAFESAIAGRYKIHGQIGRGTRATVYRAQDAASGDPIAVKVLHADLAAALDYPRFVTQMRNAGRVEHPGILPLLDVGEVAGRLFCASPLLDGESLRSRLSRERQLPLSAAITIARQIADALGQAHSAGVLHKDVKPENVFLSGSQALVMDLGLSRAITRSMEETRTGTGLALGSPAYMSPEHTLGSVEIDGRADLYSLGCVLYEMLAGQPPFTAAKPSALWMKTVTDTPAPIATMRESLPPDVGVTIDRLLAKTPSARFPDAAHLVDALSALPA